MADDWTVTWPALFVAIDWVERHCVIPDGPRAGQPFDLADWQAWFYVNHYRVREAARPDQNAPAFWYRRSQIVLPQKAGKAPLTASQICLEGVGPALFAGWAEPGDVWRCSDHGCRCGWVYRYARGEAMGRPWPTPLIQVTATSEEQTANIYDALRPMIDDGPLHDVVPKTGEEFIRLPRRGRVDTVTSSARSRLGQRVTFCPQDETGLWTPGSGMVKVADTQRRGLAGMGGRAVETTNAWDPAEHSVAQLTAESSAGDIFRLHPLPPADLDYAIPAQRRRIHEVVYAGSPWVDLDAIEAEAAELAERDLAQAERFFGNRVVQGAGSAFSAARWAELHRPDYVPADGALITIGVDGARFSDAIAVVATEVSSGHQWPLRIIERPDGAPDSYEHDLDDVDAAVLEACDRWNVWRWYVDPQYIGVLVDRWRGRWGDRVFEWFTYRERPIAFAVRNFSEAIATGELSHDGDPVHAAHIGNAVKRPVRVRDDDQRPMYTLAKPRDDRRKIDASMASVLSWEARGDAIAAGATAPPPPARSRVMRAR